MPSPIPAPPPFASATLSGVVSTIAQQFAGDKTFLGKLLMSGNALAFAQFTTAGRPDPTLNTGAVIYNTDDDKLQFSDGVAWFTIDSSAGSFVLKSGDTMTGDLLITGAGLIADTAFNTLVVDSINHRVGVKTAAPTVELDVQGACRVTSTLDLYSALANTKLRVFNDATRVVGFGYQANDFRAHLHDSTDKFSWRATAAGASLMELLGTGNLTVDAADNTFIVDAVNNRVGIGTPSPTQPLTVNGIIYSSSGGFRFPDASTQISAFVPSSYVAKIGDTMSGTLTITGAGLDVDSADHSLFVDHTTNRVAIGINNPARSLHIKQSVSADHLVTIENTNVAGSSGIAFMDNAGTERFRIGYASPSWGTAPLADLCFIQTDSTKDLIIAHAGALAHRFFTNGNVKFDPTDNTLFVDAVNNRVAMGIGTASVDHFVDIDTTLATKKLVRIRNASSTGFSAIEFFNNVGTAIGSIGISGAGASPANVWGIDSGGNTFALRNGATTYHTFGNSGNITLDVADNTFVLDAANDRITLFSPTNGGTGAGFNTPFVVDVVGSDAVQVIRGGGTNRKGLSIRDNTNNRTWTWDHATSTNNNRFELWYHNGTSENRVLTMTTTGRLGINNVTPTVELDVSGSAQFSGGLVVDTNTLIVDATADQVGIGTTPAAGNKLDVAGTIHSSAADVTPISPGTGKTVNYIGQLRRGFYKVTVTEAALTDADGSQDIVICSIPAKGRVVSVIADTTAAFTGGGATTVTLKFGKTTGGVEYLLGHDIFTTPVTKGLLDADLGTSINRANAVQGGDLPSWSATTDLSARFEADVNVADLTTGSVTFYITVEFM